MSETFVCHVHSTEAPASGRGCEACYAEWEQRRPAAEMTPDERVAELERWCGQLSIPVGNIHQRVQELVGRPVYSHEIGLAFDQLREEAWHRTGQMPSDETITARAGLSGKPVVIVSTQ